MVLCFKCQHLINIKSFCAQCGKYCRYLENNEAEQVKHILDCFDLEKNKQNNNDAHDGS